MVKLYGSAHGADRFTLCQHQVYGRVLRATVQFDHVTLLFYNILWCKYALTLTSLDKLSHSEICIGCHFGQLLYFNMSSISCHPE